MSQSGKTTEIEFIETLPQHVEAILSMTKAIASYEKMADEVHANSKILQKSLFERNEAKVVLVRKNGKDIGYLMYFFNFSSFEGRSGLYIEDIFLLPEYRNQGIGSQIFDYAEGVARAHGCPRMDWVCLDWNQSARTFYEKKGAKPQTEWVLYRKDLSR